MTDPVMPQIKKVVFLMLENRSLDNVLGWLYRDDSPKHVFPKSSSPAYDGLIPGRYTNPAHVWTGRVKNYPVVPVPSDIAEDDQRVPAYDPYEEFKTGAWNGVMNQLFGNQDRIKNLPKPNASANMLGFLQDYYTKYMLTWQGLDILWTYTPAQLPTLNSLARQYAVSDRWYCSVPSQTNPNRAFSLCGTSLGRESNERITAVEQFDIPTIFNALSNAGKSWGLYYTDNWKNNLSYTEYTFPQITQATTSGETGSLQKFYEHASAGTLPDFTYIEPKWGGGKGGAYVQGTDLHPPAHVGPGDQFIAQLYAALRGSPQWEEMLFVVTFDEHGGTYDHVSPPWGAINPDGKKGKNGFNFDLFGVRVPTIFASPFIEAGTVFRAPEGSSYPFDHTSFLKSFLLWAGVDLTTVDFGKRMPKAPTFEGVLSDQIANDGLSLESIADVIQSTLHTGVKSLAREQGESPLAGPLNDLFEGIDFVGIKAILSQNDSIAEILSDIETYKRDPDAYLADLS